MADTGPLNYLILIGRIELLGVLFQKVTLPGAVFAELLSRRAPQAVRAWVGLLPEWADVRDPLLDFEEEALFRGIDAGEQAAIRLARQSGADLLLMDDRKGAQAASKLGLRVTGTLGVLDLAASRGLTDFVKAIGQLRETNFRMPQALVESLMEKHRPR